MLHSNDKAVLLIVGLIELEGLSLQEARVKVGFMSLIEIDSSIEKLISKQESQLNNQKVIA
jgi:hypothetical protein